MKSDKYYCETWQKKYFIFFILMIVIACYIHKISVNEEEKLTSVAEKVSETEEMASDVVKTFKIISQGEKPPFALRENSIDFMNKHPDYFNGDKRNLIEIITTSDNETDYKQLSKNISKHSGKLLSVSGRVIDVREYPEANVTYIHIFDIDDGDYVLYYLGILENINEDIYAAAYVLPLDIITFKNMNNTYTEVPVVLKNL